MPRSEQSMTTMLAEETTAKPSDGVIAVILDPIVVITRSPNITKPIWESPELQ
jgi:hypothetical protein